MQSFDTMLGSAKSDLAKSDLAKFEMAEQR